MDEIKLGQAQARGARAEALLGSDVFKEVIAGLQADYIQAWKTTKARDSEAREKLWAAVNIVGLVRDHLVKYAQDGRIATKDLANIKYLKR